MSDTDRSPQGELLPKGKKRYTLRERLDVEGGTCCWKLSPILFGEEVRDITDFMSYNYVFFLDHVASREELVRGLRELSPLADDALDIAEHISDQDFIKFKLALRRERASIKKFSKGTMPPEYLALVIPVRFPEAILAAEEFEEPLGVTLIRNMENEEKARSSS